MICPACSTRELAPFVLDGGLRAERCPGCQGVWVELERYKNWRKTMPQLAASEVAGDIAAHNSAVRLCPATGRLMTRIRVACDNPLLLDYSPAAQAVWLDAGEWERLVALGLHDELDAIVSEKWQAALKLAASQDRLEKLMRARFGDEHYDKLSALRTWLAAQENRSEMLAFLQSNTD